MDPEDFVKIGYKLGNEAPVFVWEQYGVFGNASVQMPIPDHPDLKLILQAKNDSGEKIYLERAAVIVVDNTDLSEGFSSFFLVKD